jgi:chromosome segregation ATPase
MTIDLRQLFKLTEGQFNEAIIQKLLEEIKEGSQTDFDYLKFRYSVKNLEQMGMDEATSTKSAFTTAAAMGLNKDKLKASIAYYEGLVHKQKEEFSQTLHAQIRKNIDARKDQISSLDKLKIENEQKIQALQREIDSIDGKKQAIQTEIDASEEKIIATREDFKSVVDHIDAIIDQDRLLFDRVL